MNAGIEQLSRRVVPWLIRKRRPVLAAALAVMCVASVFAVRLYSDLRSGIEELLPETAPSVIAARTLGTRLRSFSRLLKGEPIGPEASLNKLYWSEMYQRLTETALQVAGESGALMPGDPDAPAAGAFALKFLQSRAMTIYSGSSEIQRNIIAERVLGLPR